MSGPCNKRWPSFLSTKKKRIEKARMLVENHLQVKTVRGEQASSQGMFSETIIVTLADGHRTVLQYRAEPLDIAPFRRARKLLGHYCPKVDLLHDPDLQELEEQGKETFYPVFCTYIEGTAWCDNPKEKKEPAFNVTVMKSLGSVLALCTSDEQSSTAVQEEIVDKLDKRLKSDNKKVDPFRSFIQGLKTQAIARKSSLEKLPLFQSHMDLNQMNIMVNHEGQVTGLIDWELSPPLQPFGMGLHRIHDLAGVFQDEIYRQREEYDEMERGLWEELMNALPDRHRRTITENLPAVQLAFTVGVILNAFDFDTGGEFIHDPTLKILPKFLTYRIPMLRNDGDEALTDPIEMEDKD